MNDNVVNCILYVIHCNFKKKRVLKVLRNGDCFGFLDIMYYYEM